MSDHPLSRVKSDLDNRWIDSKVLRRNPQRRSTHIHRG